MKKTALFAILFFLYTQPADSQELPKIVPPSPNASAFHVYGNTQVNYYTGSPNISIPIHTVKEGDLTLPIYLKYTGGNGIKVEETASWVGLGWTLNTGGAISRTIRGLPDDTLYQGFLYLNELPNYDDFTTRALIESNKIDTEPDNFMYTYPGGFGSFSYDISNNFQSKPKDDVLISHTLGVEAPPSIPNSNQLVFSHSILNFKLKDTYGNLFTFSDKERSYSRPLLAEILHKSSYPSSWYLSKIQNFNKTREINLSYESFYYSLVRKNFSFSPNYANEHETLNKTDYLGKRLQNITFSQGKVEFIASVNNRKDLSDNKYLEKILVKDRFDNLIKEVRFFYKYMSPDGLLDINAPTTEYDESDLRLVLVKIQEFDNNGKAKPSYRFGYYNAHYLPNKNSKSVDHWGYYNGAYNTRLEPKQYITYFDQFSTNSWKTFYSGSADRNSNSVYGKSGILKTIEYPTGGSVNFEYEPHTVVSDEISGVLNSSNIVLSKNGSQSTNYQDFKINLYSNTLPLSAIRLGQGPFVNPTNCDIQIHVKKLASGEKKSILIPNQVGGVRPTQIEEIFFGSGDYRAWFTLESNRIKCPNTNTAIVSLEWDNEESNINKQVGGVRIKTIKSYDKLNALTSSSFYEYNDSLGNSSGALVTIPVYYGITMTLSGNNLVPLHYKKFLKSMLPLLSTQGSNVGYGKVTIKKMNSLNLSKNGKSEYYYTTSKNYPDTFNGINPLTGDNLFTIYSGKKFRAYPIVETDSKDFIRGLLTKEVHYKGNESSFSKVYKKNIVYDINRYTPIGVTPNYPLFMTKGMRYNGDDASFKALYYDLYSGYGLVSSIEETHYYKNDSIKSITKNTFLKNDDFITQYNIPIEKQRIDSKGEKLLTKNYYPNDVNGVSSLGGDPLNTTEELPAINKLKDQHRIAEPIQVDVYKDLDKDGVFENSELLSRQRTNYKIWPSGIVLPKDIEDLKGTYNSSNNLQERITYHDYDDYGNPLEVSKADGTHIVYIWGYKHTQPIAKIENATYAQVSSWVANLQVLSNADTDHCRLSTCKEQKLRNALTSLRTNLPNALVTTYTYDPLIGVTSITDPRGDTVYYEYDDFNRLKHVKDKDGHILSKNEYNYKN